MTRSEPTRARRRMSPEERRAQLMRCALAVFAERGLRRAAHADVARVAGVAVSTVFLYFPTRKDLVDAVLSEVERFYLELAEQVHASDAAVPEVMREHGRRFRASIDSHPDHAAIWLNWGALVRGETFPRYMALADRMVAIAERTIRRGLREGSVAPGTDAEATARILIGTAHMSAHLKLSDFDPGRTERIASTIVGALLGDEGARPAA